MALRADVVATTNSFAPNVFDADGSTYDLAKFHPYSNISGFYLTAENKGTWKGKDESTWRVEELKLEKRREKRMLHGRCGGFPRRGTLHRNQRNDLLRTLL